METSRNPLSEDEIKKWFGDQPMPPDDTYELALVMGGTVSAGAYTAGALDFFIEAMDAWYAARDAGDPDAPNHKVRLKLITGTSGGSVNALIASRALAFDYKPVSRATPLSNGKSGNPFYDTWLGLQFADFLNPADLKSGSIQSLLNGKPIDLAADNLVNFTAAFKPRAYLGDPENNVPLEVMFTLTNLHGIPYITDFGKNRCQTFVDHADYVRFAVVYPNIASPSFRPDQLAIGFGDARFPQATTWGEMGAFAKGSCAFPLGFPARPLTRPLDHYRYRIVPVPKFGGGFSLRPLSIDWQQLEAEDGSLPDDYHFLAVDGGATDNEPIQLARNALAGFGITSPRDPDQAFRGVFLIDPFAGAVNVGDTISPKVPAIAFSTISTLIQQTRYDTSDLMLAGDENVFSRFMLTAINPNGKTGEKAIASGGLGAFIGFACPAFLRHDYLLGRANCQKFLKEDFVLGVDNKIIKNTWTPAQIAKYSSQENGKSLVPLVPLFGNAAVSETLDPWPKGQLNPDAFKDSIETRWKALVETETDSSWFSKFAGWLAGTVTEGSTFNFISKKISEALKEWDL